MKRFAMFLLVVAACGGSGGGTGDDAPDAAGGGSSRGSCDFADQCVDYAWTGNYSEEGLRQACLQDGGTPGDLCSHAGIVGGCRVVVGSGSDSLSTTQWYRSGTVDDIMASCAQIGGTYVSP